MKRKNPVTGAGCLPVSRACLATLPSCIQACCHPWGFGKALHCLGQSGDFAGAVWPREAVALCGNTGRPMCPPGQTAVARVCCSAQQVR